jgi:hypothetical protein
MSPRAIQAGAQ